jgi:FMN phosphatase YigB (HAD superfamily)
MKKSFADKGIKAVGFGLENTLLAPNEERDESIIDPIIRRFLLKHPYMARRGRERGLEKARRVFNGLYEDFNGSMIRVLMALNYEDCEGILEECFIESGVLDLIQEDERLASVLERVHEDHYTYLVTHFPKDATSSALERWGIDPNMFDLRVCGDVLRDPPFAFNYIEEDSEAPPENHVYVDGRREGIIYARDYGTKTIGVWSDIEEADISLPRTHDILETLYP